MLSLLKSYMGRILPDGYYDISSINPNIQQFCIANGLYLVIAAGEYVYYLELVENSTYYAI